MSLLAEKFVIDQRAGWSSRYFAKKVYKEQVEWLKKAISSFGFPTINLVGKKGAQHAWIIVHHADHDPVFQKKYLSKLRKLFQEKQANAQDLALLEDRVKVNSKKPQIYGTQLKKTKKGFMPYKILNPAVVDNLRKSVGFGPLAEYIAYNNRIMDITKDGSCYCGSGKKFMECHGK